MRVLLIHDNNDAPGDAVSAIERHHEVVTAPLSEALSVDPRDVLLCAIDVDLSVAASTRTLRVLAGQLLTRTPRILIVNAFARRQVMAAYGLGIHDFLERPFEEPRVQEVLHKLTTRSVEAFWGDLSPIQQSALKMSFKLFEDVMVGAQNGQPPVMSAVAECGEAVVAALSEQDLQSWLLALRDHHNYTFRHVMFVTGTLVAFANHLGIRGRDLQNVVAAGILHDIGKANVPLEVLDKPGKLNEAEWLIMRRHPVWGAQIVANSGWAPEVVDAVLHHHERLDGNGYPDGLAGPRVPDLTRLVSIADVFSALIDKRAYKSKMSGAEAIDMMRSADGQLDQDLVTAFTPIARSIG